eukprot:2245878-Lingulodinium_polyedra.AAC.1
MVRFCAQHRAPVRQRRGRPQCTGSNALGLPGGPLPSPFGSGDAHQSGAIDLQGSGRGLFFEC